MSKIVKLAVVGIFLFGFGGKDTLAQEQAGTQNFNKAFAHVVYFWLNNPEDPQDRRDFVKAIQTLMNNSEYAETKFIGIPAETPREVVDNSYTFSLILTFPSREAQDKYQEEPAHLRFIEDASHLWKRVQVYDSVGLEE